MITPCTVSGIACVAGALLDDRPRELLEEERVALAALQDRASRPRRRSLDRRRPIPAARALSPALSGPIVICVTYERSIQGGAVARPVGRDQEDPGREQLADQRRQELLGGSIDPVQVLDDDDEWPLGRCFQEQQAQRVERARLDCLGAERRRGQPARPRCRSGEAATRRRRPEARCRARPRRWPARIAAGESVSSTPQCARSKSISGRYGTRLPYDTQRPSRIMLDSGARRHRARRLVHQPRLAHAGLANHADGVALAGHHLREQAVEQRDFAPAANEGPEHAPGLQHRLRMRPEPGDPKRGRPSDLPRGFGLHVPGNRPLGRVADQDGARLGELLEQRGGAERIADGDVLDVLADR